MSPHINDFQLQTNIRGVKARTLVDHPDAIIKTLILDANQAIETHQAPVAVTFFVLEGSGIITIGDTPHDVAPWHCLECPKNTPMSIQAGSNGMQFLNIKTPRFIPTK